MKPLVLTIIDGLGINKNKQGNAYLIANTPNLDNMIKEYPNTHLKASGEAVGLPKGQMGNSEVGHLNISAGRIVYQPLEMISREITSGAFFHNKNLLEIMNHVKTNNSKLHIFGLLSDGGIHSHINHIFALIDMAKSQNVKNIYIHAFLDGRDTPPKSAIKYLEMLEKKIKDDENVSLADISGRYYSMDRERMWKLTKQYYNLLVYKHGKKITDYHKYIEKSYKKSITDEFIKPAIIDKNGYLNEDDGLIFANFRPDRATQTFTAITNDQFSEFKTKHFKNIKLLTMMPVEKSIKCINAYPHITVNNSLGEYLSAKNKKVLRIAEASKYPHVTYFFDGGKEITLKNTDKIIIPRKNVATYDLAPRMSADEITDKLLEVIDQYDVVILNFANCDMVGHTGNLEATIEAIEAVDENIGRIYKKVKELEGLLIITADHGNAEVMVDQNNSQVTKHTTSEVPFIICDKKYQLAPGKLADIAPTILTIMGLPIPKEMTGDVLISEKIKL